jgi:hypothetical protein
MAKRYYTRENVERALAYHKAQGNIGDWYRRDAGYWVGITDFPPVFLRTLRETHVFVLGLASASKASRRRAANDAYALGCEIGGPKFRSRIGPGTLGEICKLVTQLEKHYSS